MVQRWKSADAVDCLWAGWDGNFVLFHRPSGRTHFVNAATALLLQRVLASPRDAASASLELTAAQHAGHSPEFLRHVEDLLVRLEDLGLVTRVAG